MQGEGKTPIPFPYFLPSPLPTPLPTRLPPSLSPRLRLLPSPPHCSANSPPLSVSLATLRVLADHYPERLAAALFVDAPPVFTWLWAVGGWVGEGEKGGEGAGGAIPGVHGVSAVACQGCVKGAAHILGREDVLMVHAAYSWTNLSHSPSFLAPFVQALSPFIDPVTKTKVVFVASKDLPPTPPSEPGQPESEPELDESAEFDSGEPPSPPLIEDYVRFYRQQYDEGAYRKLLGRVGWPE